MKIIYFVNGANYGKLVFDRILGRVKAERKEFTIEQVYYWEGGKYKTLKDLKYKED